MAIPFELETRCFHGVALLRMAEYRNLMATAL
jgi:hypothetical protein